MITKIFSIYDSKAERHLPPFFMSTKGEAIRAVTDALHDSNHQFCRHSEDYTLFELGEFSDIDAEIRLHEAKVSLGNLLEFKKPVSSSLSNLSQ